MTTLTIASNGLYTTLEDQMTLSQKFTSRRIIPLISSDIKYSWTNDNEVLFFNQLDNSYVDLIVDEFGGLTVMVHGTHDSDYCFEYFDHNELENIEFDKLVLEFLN